MYTANVSKIF